MQIGGGGCILWVIFQHFATQQQFTSQNYPFLLHFGVILRVISQMGGGGGLFIVNFTHITTHHHLTYKIINIGLYLSPFISILIAILLSTHIFTKFTQPQLSPPHTTLLGCLSSLNHYYYQLK